MDACKINIGSITRSAFGESIVVPRWTQTSHQTLWVVEDELYLTRPRELSTNINTVSDKRLSRAFGYSKGIRGQTESTYIQMHMAMTV